MRRALLYLGSMLGVAACSSEEVKMPAPAPGSRVVVATDFEDIGGWASDNPSLNQEQARSGHYSIKAGKKVEYSLTYTALLGQVSASPIRRMQLNAWVYKTRPVDATLVAQVLRSAQDEAKLTYQSVDLGRDIKKAGVWTPVSMQLDVPAEATADSQLRIYLWNGDPNVPIYLDDLTLSVEP